MKLDRARARVRGEGGGRLDVEFSQVLKVYKWCVLAMGPRNTNTIFMSTHLHTHTHTHNPHPIPPAASRGGRPPLLFCHAGFTLISMRRLGPKRDNVV